MFIEMCFSFIPEIIFIPFVISNIPVNSELEIWFGRPKWLQIGSNMIDMILFIPLALSIDIITEKSTTKPPIIRTVEIAEDILSPSTSPSVEIVIFCNLFSELDAYCIFSLGEFFFQNLNKMPTVIQPNM